MKTFSEIVLVVWAYDVIKTLLLPRFFRWFWRE